jgi:hypothetical protein
MAVDAERVARAQALVPPGGRDDLAALAATVRDAPPAELANALDRLEFTAPERDLIVSAASAPAITAAADDAELWARLRRLPAESVAVAGAAGDADTARHWLHDVRHRRLAITGDDLVAAGLSGPAVGAALERAMVAHLRGDARDREAQLEHALSI